MMNWFNESLKLAEFQKLVKTAGKLKDVTFYGTLKSNKGYIYLKVDDGLFEPFLNMLNNEKAIHPDEDPNKTEDKKIGAHISVVRKNENNDLDIKEIGQEFSFSLTGAKHVKPDGWDEVKKVYFLTVDSPELEDLRKKYKLSPKINDHDFHITFSIIPA
jgi:hypothetical protein